MALTTGEGGGEAPAKIRGTWEWVFDQVREIASGLIQEALKNYRPRGLGGFVLNWDSGVAGTALTAEPTRPTQTAELPYPCEINKVRVQAYPPGSATIDVFAAGPDTDLTAAASITGGSLATISGARESTDTTLAGWTKTHEGRSRFFGYLTTVSTVERLSVNVEVRRT